MLGKGCAVSFCPRILTTNTIIAATQRGRNKKEKERDEAKEHEEENDEGRGMKCVLERQGE